jgi:hypothetical protein
MDVPAPSAPFAEKMAYYRAQHSSDGVKATHLIGIPTLLLSLPLLAARPRIGSPCSSVAGRYRSPGTVSSSTTSPLSPAGRSPTSSPDSPTGARRSRSCSPVATAGHRASPSSWRPT